jgi:hypothetical protein
VKNSEPQSNLACSSMLNSTPSFVEENRSFFLVKVSVKRELYKTGYVSTFSESCTFLSFATLRSLVPEIHRSNRTLWPFTVKEHQRRSYEVLKKSAGLAKTHFLYNLFEKLRKFKNMKKSILLQKLKSVGVRIRDRKRVESSLTF